MQPYAKVGEALLAIRNAGSWAGVGNRAVARALS